MKKICIITRIRNDEFFLKKWIKYYGSQVGESNLFVYLDGMDQNISFDCGDVNIIKCERIAGHVVDAEKRRLKFLSDMAAIHLNNYDIIIGVDVDEFLVVDPKLNLSLPQYLSKKEINISLSGLGVDVGQHLEQEKIINDSQPFLEQRQFAVLSSRYTKPCVITKPVVWGSGFHRVKKHNFHIDENLFLFHFGCFDMQMLLDRFKDADRMKSGWERHIKKRTRTIDYVTKIKAKSGDKWMPIARLIQTYTRPIYAWNKPSMLFLTMVVSIPERFRKTL
ncbi:MAG: glycosyltransferase family 2 protein [Bacteroidales bacterium]|nr:glycosyltransferase family 2 protein [Bacteroidales bacterium]